jgi:hypothetical protein
MSELSTDWKQIRQALKHGASLHADGEVFWLTWPIDSRLGLQILTHPAVLPVSVDGHLDYQTFRWRSESPARKALEAMKAGRGAQ